LQSKTLNILTKGDVKYITFPKLQDRNEIRHIFSTRLGGVSEGRYKSMNLSFNNGDNRENVLENYKIICDCAGININNLVLSKQTHTNNVMIVDESHRGTGIFKKEFSDIDGLITNCPGVALVTQYADCTPLLFFDPVKKVIASSHAGWRGTALEIGRVTIEKMHEHFGCSPENIIAGIGPCIGNCCYEVDDPVYNAYKEISYLNLDKVFTKKTNGKYMLDNAMANFEILVNAGIKPENIDVSDICTNCNADELHSHRATKGERGNLAAFIELK